MSAKTPNPANVVSVVASRIQFTSALNTLISLKKIPSLFMLLRQAKTLDQALNSFGFQLVAGDTLNTFTVKVVEGKIPDLSILSILKRFIVSGSYIVLAVDNQDVVLEFRNRKVSAKDLDCDFEEDCVAA